MTATGLFSAERRSSFTFWPVDARHVDRKRKALVVPYARQADADRVYTREPRVGFFDQLPYRSDKLFMVIRWRRDTPPVTLVEIVVEYGDLRLSPADVHPVDHSCAPLESWLGVSDEDPRSLSDSRCSGHAVNDMQVNALIRQCLAQVPGESAVRHQRVDIRKSANHVRTQPADLGSVGHQNDLARYIAHQSIQVRFRSEMRGDADFRMNSIGTEYQKVEVQESKAFFRPRPVERQGLSAQVPSRDHDFDFVDSGQGPRDIETIGHHLKTGPSLQAHDNLFGGRPRIYNDAADIIPDQVGHGLAELAFGREVGVVFLPYGKFPGKGSAGDRTAAGSDQQALGAQCVQGRCEWSQSIRRTASPGS